MNKPLQTDATPPEPRNFTPEDLGAEIVRELAARGSDVAFTFRRNEEAAAAVAESVSNAGRQAWTIGLDLRNHDGCARAVEPAARGVHEHSGQVGPGHGPHQSDLALAVVLDLAEGWLVEPHHERLDQGQARRVGVARALALRPKLIIADEPTAGLDVSIQGEIFNILAELRETMSLSSLIITHNLHVVRHLADRMVIMYHGEIVESGATETVVANPKHSYTKVLLEANLHAKYSV